MSVFNENGALVYANNSGVSNVSLDSIIAESTRMDNVLEGMVMESIGQFDAANIVLESVGYYNESVKEVLVNAAAKAWEAVLKGIDTFLNYVSAIAPNKDIIRINKKKIIDKFASVRTTDNAAIKECAKSYNTVSRLDSGKLVTKIKNAINVAKKTHYSYDDMKKEMSDTLDISLGDNWKLDINHDIGPDLNAGNDMSTININSVIETAVSVDKNIPEIKQCKREVEKLLKNAEKSLRADSDEKTADKSALSMVSFYCVKALSSLKTLTLSSVKLCMAVLKYKEPKEKNDSKKDSKSNNSDTSAE